MTKPAATHPNVILIHGTELLLMTKTTMMMMIGFRVYPFPIKNQYIIATRLVNSGGNNSNRNVNLQSVFSLAKIQKKQFW